MYKLLSDLGFVLGVVVAVWLLANLVRGIVKMFDKE